MGFETDRKKREEPRPAREPLMGGHLRCLYSTCGEKLYPTVPYRYGYADCAVHGPMRIFNSCGFCGDTGTVDMHGKTMACPHKCETGMRVAEMSPAKRQARDEHLKHCADVVERCGKDPVRRLR
jgi:hypothetical protein